MVSILRDTRKERRVCCRLIRPVHARSQFVWSYTNVHVNWMTSSVRTKTPRDWVKVGATENKRGKKEDSLSLSLSFSWWAPLSRFFAGVPRDWMPHRPGRHRDARFRSIILTADSMISFALLPFFSPFSHSCLVEHGCAQTTGARPPGYSEQIEEKICQCFFIGRTHSNRSNPTIRWIIHIFQASNIQNTRL